MTNSFVVDAGLTFRFLAPGAAHDQLRPLFDRWREDGASLIAPTLWVYEMTSVIAKTVYFEQLTKEEGTQLLRMMSSLEIQLILPNDDLMRRAYRWTHHLNRAAAYDSFYLALAESMRCEFWTADRKLYHAANQPWVKFALTDAS